MADDFLSEVASPDTKPKDDGEPVVIKADLIDEWMKVKEETGEQPLCCLLYGRDGTAKSGIALDFLSEQDIKDGYKGVVIDIGSSCEPLKKYHLDLVKSGQLRIRNPMSEDPETFNIDYIETFAKIKGIINWIRKNHEKEKIKFMVFDGLSETLKYAEYQMRLDKHLDTDGGVQQRFWLKRNKYFLEILEQVKSLPIHKFFVSHEDFIITDSDAAAVKVKTNNMMFQKIKCERLVEGDVVVFKATIDKSKFDIKAEGKTVTIAKIKPETGEFKWSTKKLFEILGGEK